MSAQQNASPSLQQYSDYCAQINQPSQQIVWQARQVEQPTWRYMTASDLGIVDQLLDDKVGMEP